MIHATTSCTYVRSDLPENTNIMSSCTACSLFWVLRIRSNENRKLFDPIQKSVYGNVLL